MNNYQYIISSLPQITLDFENKPFDFDSLIQEISLMCSDRDKRLVEWILFGLKEENLNNHFYRSALKVKNSFIREFFTFELSIRNIQVAHLSRLSKNLPDNFLIGDSCIVEAIKTNKSADFGLSSIIDYSAKIFQILNNPNILEREHQIDLLKWSKANEICVHSYFDIDIILCYILKASLVKRWSSLDKDKGEQLLKQLVDEVRGTFSLKNI